MACSKDGWTQPILFVVNEKDGNKDLGIFFQGMEAELEPGNFFEIKPDMRPEYAGEFLLYPMTPNTALSPRFVSKILKKKGAPYSGSTKNRVAVLKSAKA